MRQDGRLGMLICTGEVDIHWNDVLWAKLVGDSLADRFSGFRWPNRGCGVKIVSVL